MTPEKARKILNDKQVRGQPITVRPEQQFSVINATGWTVSTSAATSTSRLLAVAFPLPFHVAAPVASEPSFDFPVFSLRSPLLCVPLHPSLLPGWRRPRPFLRLSCAGVLGSGPVRGPQGQAVSRVAGPWAPGNTHLHIECREQVPCWFLPYYRFGFRLLVSRVSCPPRVATKRKKWLSPERPSTTSVTAGRRSVLQVGGGGRRPGALAGGVQRSQSPPGAPRSPK